MTRHSALFMTPLSLFRVMFRDCSSRPTAWTLCSSEQHSGCGKRYSRTRLKARYTAYSAEDDPQRVAHTGSTGPRAPYMSPEELGHKPASRLARPAYRACRVCRFALLVEG